MRIRITADSTCDLSAAQLEDFGFRARPLYVFKGEESFLDGRDIATEDVFAWFEAGKGLCKTAAPNLSDYEEFFAETLKDCDGIVHFTISSDMSSCCANARLAAEEYENVYVVDSRNLSSGIVLLMLEAKERAEAGVSAQKIARAAQESVERVETSFIIDSLDYLAKGGRCSTLAAFGANKLKIKPCICVRDGKMSVGRKYRGNFDAVAEHYVRDRLAGRDDIDPKRIFLTATSRVGQPLLDRLEALIRELYPFAEVLRAVAGCTISSQCGSVALGILFMTKE